MPNIEHLSYSSVSLYNACARAWRYRYVDKMRTPTSSNLVFGSAFHDTIEAALSLMAHGEEPELPEVWQHHWQKQLERNADVTYAGTSPDELCEQGLHMVTSPLEISDNGRPAKCANLGSFLKTLQLDTDPSRNALRLEERVTLAVPGVPVPIVGFVDLVTSDGVPCDLKTAARAWAPDKADQELQPTFYLAALNQAGHQIGNFRYYIFTKAKTPKVQIIDTHRNASDMFWLIEALGETYRAIEAGVYPPTGAGSWKCTPDFCEFWSACKK